MFSHITSSNLTQDCLLASNQAIGNQLHWHWQPPMDIFKWEEPYSRSNNLDAIIRSSCLIPQDALKGSIYLPSYLHNNTMIEVLLFMDQNTESFKLLQ